MDALRRIHRPRKSGANDSQGQGHLRWKRNNCPTRGWAVHRRDGRIMDMTTVQIQESRLRQDLLDLARFGEDQGRGITRTALNDADLAARQWFKERMRETGLKVYEGAAANLMGRMDSTVGPTGGPCIPTGR